jgi:hypothetical protein
MSGYLLEISEDAELDDKRTQYTIEANDKQMVKYHFHRTLKDVGYTDTQYGKHCVKGVNEKLIEIHDIQSLTEAEYKFLSVYMPEWDKV